MSIARWIERWAGTDRVAIRFEGAAVTYAELADRVTGTAAALAGQHQVGPGHRVGFCGLNRLELFEALLACARLGAVLVPLNNRLTAAELTVQIDDSEPTVLLATDSLASALERAAGGRPIRDLDDDPLRATPAATTGPPPDHVGDDDIVLMVYTSGTTGQAKGAMLSHRAIVHTVRNGIDHQRLTAADRIVAPLPTFHVGGLTVQTLPTLAVGGEVVLQRRFEPAETLALLEQHDATQTLLVPAMLTAVAALPAFATAQLSSLRGVNSGSSIVPAAAMAPWFDRGVPVGQVYGTTETGPTAIVLGYEEAAERMGSCGRPATHTEVRVIGDDGTDVDTGRPGELLVRGPNVFSGYWRAPDATAAAFVDGRWFRTGDVGVRDADGYYHIADRITDVVITGGENVYPAEVEPVLAAHPAVAEVAVIGRPDDRWGEVPVAVVVPAAGAAEPSVDELRRWCDGRLARFKHPAAVVVAAELPRTALGKVRKHELRATLAATHDDGGDDVGDDEVR